MTHEAVPYLDLAKQYRGLREEILEAVDRVLGSGEWILGSEVRELEGELSRLCGGGTAVGVASGTDALYLALRALDLKPGDEVIVPSFTFFATAGIVANSGARPVFADVSAESFHLTASTLAAALSPRTRAVIPVHLFGQCAPMDEIGEVLSSRPVSVIEDAAQSLGAAWKDRPAGAWGNLAAFSFYPTKNLGACGDGGLVVSRDAELGEKVRRLRVHGAHPKYLHHNVGTNSRLDAVQAAILRVKLKRLPVWERARARHAARYDEALKGLDGIRTPVIDPRAHCVWNQYTIRIERGSRDRFQEALKTRGIPTAVYYPLPLHLQPCFAALGYAKGDLPASESLADRVVSLPVDPEMSDAVQDRVIDAVRDWSAGALL